MTAPQLRELPVSARAGLSFLLLTVLGGLVASGLHLVGHHENRDERPGLSMSDLEGAYHGVRTTAPLVAALDRGHPEALGDAEREALSKWLAGDRISEDYDNIDLGENAPAEVLDRACLSCHARQAEQGDGIGQRLPLEYWDDVKKLAFSREVEPGAPEILLASAHTHALGMGTLSLVLGLMALCTRWRRGVIGALVLICGLALFCDLGAWGLAREIALLVPVIAVSGAAWMASTAALAVLALADLWWPGGSRAS